MEKYKRRQYIHIKHGKGHQWGKERERERVGAGNTRQLIQSANQKGTSLCVQQWWKISEIPVTSDD